MANTAGTDEGQVFADLLFIAAMSCQAPMALISVHQADGQWSTLGYGVDGREALNDPQLFAAVAASPDGMEISDLARHELGAGVLGAGPLAVQFVHGLPVLGPEGSVVGVLCILDRSARKLSRQQHQAIGTIARQVSAQLAHWRRRPGPATVSAGPRSTTRDHGRDRKPPAAPPAGPFGVAGLELGERPHLLRSHEVAVLFDVTERTVINWAASGKLASLRTAGGHLRFPSTDVMALLDNQAGSATGRPCG